MTKYMVLEAEDEDGGSATLCEAEHLRSIIALDPSATVVKEFEAVCWCAAKIVYAAHQGHRRPTPWPCQEDNEKGECKCPHYESVAAQGVHSPVKE